MIRIAVLMCLGLALIGADQYPLVLGPQGQPQQISQGDTLNVPLTSGLFSALPSPAASNVAMLYWATDTNLIYRSTGSAWVPVASGGSGTVSSVGLALPGIFSVTGSPVTSSGTLSAALTTQSPGAVWAGPISGGAAQPTFRALTSSDIPALPYDATGAAAAVLASSAQKANNLSDLASASAARTNLGLGTAATQATGTFLQVANNLSDVANAATARSNLGAGTGNGTVTSVGASVPSFLSIAGSPVTGSGTLAISLSGTALPVANGGTGETSATAYALLAGGTTSTGALQSLAGLGTSGQVLMSNGASALPSWQNAAASGVTSVGLALPAIFSVSGSPVTSSGTLTGTLATQTANQVWASPTTGSAAAPTFRTLVAADLPATYLVASNNLSDVTSASTARTNIGAGTGNGSVTSVAASAPSWLTVGGSPVTTSGTLALTATAQTANTVLAGPSTGSAAASAFRALVAADIPALSYVTSVAASVPAFLSVSGSPVTSSGTLAISLSGTALPIANGGTNSTTALSGNTIMVSNGTAVVQGSAGTTTTVLHGNASGSPSYGAVALSTDVSGTLPVANGGTGVATLTAYGVLTGGTTSTGALQQVSGLGTSGQVLTSQGAAALPIWAAGSSGTGLNFAQPTGTPVTLNSLGTPGDTVLLTHSAVTSEQWFTTVAKYISSPSVHNYTLTPGSTWTQQNSSSGTQIASGVLSLYGTGTSGGTFPKVPLTSNTAPSPYVAADMAATPSSNGVAPWHAFINQNNYAAGQWEGSTSTNYWLSLDVGTGYAGIATSYNVGAYQQTNSTPNNWSFQGSNDDSTWTTLDSRSGQGSALNASSTTTGTNYTISGAASYRYYRLNVSGVVSGSGIALNLLTVTIASGTSYPTGTLYYATTINNSTSASAFPSLTAYAGATLSATITSAANSQTLVGMISTDAGTTWYAWSGSAWVSHTLSSANLTTYGNAMSTLQTQLTSLPISSLPGAGTSLDFAYGLESSSSTVTPTLSSVALAITPAAGYQKATVGSFGSTADFGLTRLTSTTTALTNQGVAPLTIYWTFGSK